MATTAYLQKQFNALRPTDQQSAEALATISNGEVVRVEITRASQRSIQHHRLFFALLGIIAEQLDWTTDQALTWCKVAVGHADAVHDRDGVVTYVPRSISFARMSQAEFTAFFERAVSAILDRLLPPGTPRSSLVEEVEERAAMMSRRAA